MNKCAFLIVFTGDKAYLLGIFFFFQEAQKQKVESALTLILRIRLRLILQCSFLGFFLSYSSYFNTR